MTSAQRRQRYDVVICGGGAAGVAAAIASARCGARVALLEQAPFLGGAATRSGVLTYCGFWTQADPFARAVGGVGAEVLAMLDALGGMSGPIRTGSTSVVIALIEPEAVKLALDRMCAAAGVDVILHARLTAVESDAAGVRTALALDHDGTFALDATAFVDASGEADLAHQAGAATRYGDAQGRVQNGTLAMRVGGIPRDADVSRAEWARAVRDAKARGANTMTKEHGLVARLPHSGEIIAFLADETYDARDARSTSAAERRAREQAWSYVQAIRALPDHERAYLIATGPAIGTRESRHVLARTALRGADVLAARSGDDTVALGAWPVELHTGPGHPNVWKRLRDDGAYGIALDTLFSATHRNLLAAGRVLDADADAFASVRVMGTAFATGQAAGVAAALVADGRPAEASTVRAEVLRQHGILELEGSPASP
ncbi:MAG: FAD-dependent oxidoreductase [Candidatus Eremiobacteraeota bacterium]|nr:FAD-dependent oxidoreductase [Candidatus Eremiobacteraeota bacterium]